MRATSEAPAGASVDEELPNIMYSPSGSATTGLSGGSSLGLQYKGAWCTPPRVFVDYQVLLFYSFKAMFFSLVLRWIFDSDINDPCLFHGCLHFKTKVIFKKKKKPR